MALASVDVLRRGKRQARKLRRAAWRLRYRITRASTRWLSVDPREIQNHHAGEQCVILGTGPSLTKADQSLVSTHPNLIGTNSAFLFTRSLRYWVCSNPTFLNACTPELLIDLRPDLYVVCRDTPMSLLLPWRRTLFVDIRRGEYTREIHCDLTRSLPWGPTVILDLALPFALWCGYSEILLLGADYPRGTYRRFDTDAPASPKRVSSPDIAREMALAHEKWQLWKAYLLQHIPNVRIINCSEGSELEAWPKLPLERAVRAAAHARA